MRDQSELALQCLEVEQAGGDVCEYLQGQGFISPRATWQRLQLNELNRQQSEIDEGEVMNQKITDEQKKEAIRKAIGGEDPRKYLAQCGSKAPTQMWGFIKKGLKEKDPATYEQLPDFRYKAEKPTAEEPKKEPTITEPVLYDGFTVRCVEGDFGKYHRDVCLTGDYLDYTTKDGDELSMTIEQWRGFLWELTNAAQVLGVELL